MARTMPNLTVSKASLPQATPIITKITHRIMANATKIIPNLASFRWIGDGGVSALLIALLILPISVLFPVLVTKTKAVPFATSVVIKTFPVHSPMGTRCFDDRISNSFFEIGRDSPVKILSITCKLLFSTTLPSAGIKSPSLRRIISPGTNSLAKTSFFDPDLTTVALGTDKLLKACMARFAFTS
eukprot:NODE_44_length_33449_cov_1.575742.p26 type:complete len:185 gc:universal NODE_44_length_33449_cov_1.575742:29941-30495(+)